MVDPFSLYSCFDTHMLWNVLKLLSIDPPSHGKNSLCSFYSIFIDSDAWISLNYCSSLAPNFMKFEDPPDVIMLCSNYPRTSLSHYEIDFFTISCIELTLLYPNDTGSNNIYPHSEDIDVTSSQLPSGRENPFGYDFFELFKYAFFSFSYSFLFSHTVTLLLIPTKVAASVWWLSLKFFSLWIFYIKKVSRSFPAKLFLFIAWGIAYPSYTGTDELTPAPQSTTRPEILPVAKSDRTLWFAK